MHCWPCDSTEAKSQLQEMIAQGSHTVRPIPAYDISGNLIEPSKYAECLKNAIVHVKVTIVRQYLAFNKTDNYYADIQEIRVIQTPARTLESPAKHKPEEALERATAKKARQ